MTEPVATTTTAPQGDPARTALGRVRQEIGKAVVGQEAVVTGLVIALLCRGPRAARGRARGGEDAAGPRSGGRLALDTKRVQFTPDLMPGDVTGSLIFDARTAAFEFREGPVFTNLLLADEINRTPPKTQSALLEVMEERQVSVEGTARPLPDPFLVAATQNPIEYEGTYPLPEAQLDRFLFKLTVPLPNRDEELRRAARPPPRVRPARPGRGRRAPGGRRGRPGRGPPGGRAGAGRRRGAGVHRGPVPGHPDRPLGRAGRLARGARPPCSARPRRGPGSPGGTTSRPTTSRPWPGRRCATGSGCGTRRSWRASPPTRCWRRCWPRCRRRGERHRPGSGGRWPCSGAPGLFTPYAVAVACGGRGRPAWWPLLTVLLDLAIAAPVPELRSELHRGPARSGSATPPRSPSRVTNTRPAHAAGAGPRRLGAVGRRRPAVRPRGAASTPTNRRIW